MGEHRCPPPASAAAPSTLPGARLNARCNAPGLFLATTLGALLLVAWRGRVWQPPTAASCQVASASRPARGHIRAASGGAARTGCATGRGVGGRLRRLCQQRFLLPHRLPRQPGAPCPLAAAAQRRPAGCSRPRGDTVRRSGSCRARRAPARARGARSRRAASSWPACSRRRRGCACNSRHARRPSAHHTTRQCACSRPGLLLEQGLIEGLVTAAGRHRKLWLQAGAARRAGRGAGQGGRRARRGGDQKVAAPDAGRAHERAGRAHRQGASAPRPPPGPAPRRAAPRGLRHSQASVVRTRGCGSCRTSCRMVHAALQVACRPAPAAGRGCCGPFPCTGAVSVFRAAAGRMSS